MNSFMKTKLKVSNTRTQQLSKLGSATVFAAGFITSLVLTKLMF